MGSVKKRVQKAGGTSHLVGSRLGCFYQPILPGFYSGDERVLKTNRTLRKKLVERMTVFLVAKPSVLLQQLTEGSAVALDLHACVFVWVAGAGWCGRREYRGGGEDVCVLGNKLRCFEQICLGGVEESWLWQCMQTYMAEAKPGSPCAFCVHVRCVCTCVWGSRITGTEWGLHQGKEPHLHSSAAAGPASALHTCLQVGAKMCLCSCQGGAVK